MADGYQLDPQQLTEAAGGINRTIGELKSIGIAEAADEGRGFGNLALTGLQAGHPDVTSALRSFTDRWEWGVRSMVKEGNAIGVLKDAVNAVGGDPHANEQQVENSSFGQIFGGNASSYRLAVQKLSPTLG